MWCDGSGDRSSYIVIGPTITCLLLLQSKEKSEVEGQDRLGSRAMVKIHWGKSLGQ